MSFPVSACPETPIIQPVPLRTKANSNMPSEDSGSSPDSLSASVCQCCESPPAFADPTSAPAASATSAAPSDREQEPSSTARADSLLQTLEIRSATSHCAQAVAVAPQDQCVPDHWVLINWLCHGIFSTFQDQGCIRNLNTYFYRHFGPGDKLVITARRVAQSGLAWLEATITTDNVLVATGTALYDGPHPRKSRETSWLMGPNDLIPDLSELGTS